MEVFDIRKETQKSTFYAFQFLFVIYSMDQNFFLFDLNRYQFLIARILVLGYLSTFVSLALIGYQITHIVLSRFLC